MSITDDYPVDGSLQWALDTASSVKDLWYRGDSPDLAKVLETFPKLRSHRTVVIELAYEEYCLRRKAGEAADAGQFSRRYRSFERSIELYITVRGIAEADPRYTALRRDVTWPEPGDRFLGFDLLREIGQGAAGRVFLATEAALGSRRVAVKLTVEGGHEANILGRLEHANIVPIYSIQADEAGELTAVCMPYQGQATLDAVLDCLYAEHRTPERASAILDGIRFANEGADAPQTRLPPDRILRVGTFVEGVIHLGAQLAEALAHAHARRIFHRDLKPPNILMAPDGRPLLLDFNLSVDDRAPDWRIGGTLPYMAPEELAGVAGEPTTRTERRPPQPRTGEPHFDPRSDLFSLGVILYELLTGVLPFGAIRHDLDVERMAARLRKRQEKGPRPLRTRNRRVDKRLAGLIESCLAFDRELRPASAEVLAAALRREISPFRRASRWVKEHRKFVLAMIVGTVVALAGAAAYVALRPPYPVREFRQGVAYYKAGEDDLALQSLNASLAAEPRSGDALLARARVNQRQGKFQLAFADYDAADHLDPSPKIAACKGYCLSQIAQYQQATAYYRRALDRGYDSPAVLNNLGYCWLRLGRLDDAEACLRKAVEADDGLQPAHHNLALVFERLAHAGQAIPREALIHARRALEIGPESGELCRNLAFLYAFAAKRDAAFLQPAFACIAKAVGHGIDPKTFRSDPVFSFLEKDPRFQEALVVRGPVQGPLKAVRVIDPAADSR